MHLPLQVPQREREQFSFIEDRARQISCHGMFFSCTLIVHLKYQYVSPIVFITIGNVTTALKTQGIWNNTLIAVHSDKQWRADILLTTRDAVEETIIP